MDQSAGTLTRQKAMIMITEINLNNIVKSDNDEVFPGHRLLSVMAQLR